MVDQGDETIHHSREGENRRESDVFLSFAQGQLLHSSRLLFRLEQSDDVQDHLGGLHHAFERHILQLAMEVVSASEDVGAWQAHEREVGAIGAATNGLHFRLDVGHLHGLNRSFHDEEMRLNLLVHVVVLVLQLQLHHIAVFLVEELHN